MAELLTIKWISLLFLILFILPLESLSRIHKQQHHNANPDSSGNSVKSGKLQSSTNSTMAEKHVSLGGRQTTEAFNIEDPEEVARMVTMAVRNSTRGRKLGYFSCGTGNPIDDCWRCNPDWQNNRKQLADCGIGFGRNAIGGRDGQFYVVTDPSDDDVINPRPGTLRYAVIQDEPLWITFKRDMVITLKQELIMNSFKTIDGRGANVHIANGACITIQFITNVIIHGLHIHDCKQTGNAMVRSSPSHYGWRTMADGDGISIFGASHIWVDHNSLSNCADGLVDAIMGSTAITISNNYFTHHNEVMLLGHSDTYVRDKQMQVTIAFNHFGEGLIQRMPRCRHGYFHVVNNDYTHWEMYAIGGSAEPTINSQGNRYLAPINPFAKEVSFSEMQLPDAQWSLLHSIWSRSFGQLCPSIELGSEIIVPGCVHYLRCRRPSVLHGSPVLAGDLPANHPPIVKFVPTSKNQYTQIISHKTLLPLCATSHCFQLKTVQNHVWKQV